MPQSTPALVVMVAMFALGGCGFAPATPYTSTGMTAVQIYGPSCDAIMGGSAKMVEIVFKCIVN